MVEVMDKVILAIDDSSYANKVVEVVSRRKWKEDMQLKILTVIEPIKLDDISSHQELLSEINDRRKDEATKLLEKTRKELSDKLKSSVHFELRVGNPKTEIVDAAVEWSADKILLGAHGRGENTAHMIGIGSTPRSVAAHAPCSVEIVRTSN